MTSTIESQLHTDS